ncbi:hypothetical protein [Streptomyces osmaniensis]|uniref:hypothetical protein n=1 Tax=Streptomyces osmaniensis TaxID=593134 RepID=UPI001C32BD0C|nr:hypothetical protein KJK32_28165 [Streptomyces sp. JCM17656]
MSDEDDLGWGRPRGGSGGSGSSGSVAVAVAVVRQRVAGKVTGGGLRGPKG